MKKHSTVQVPINLIHPRAIRVMHYRSDCSELHAYQPIVIFALLLLSVMSCIPLSTCGCCIQMHGVRYTFWAWALCMQTDHVNVTLNPLRQ